jgi:hypothetical protein
LKCVGVEKAPNCCFLGCFSDGFERCKKSENNNLKKHQFGAFSDENHFQPTLSNTHSIQYE